VFYTVKAAVLAIQSIQELPPEKQQEFGLTEADKRWADRMSRRWDYTVGNPPHGEVHCRSCHYEPKNRERPGWFLCLHPEALKDPDNKNPCKYYKGLVIE